MSLNQVSSRGSDTNSPFCALICGAFGDCENATVADAMRTGASKARTVVDTREQANELLRDPGSDLAQRWWWRAFFREEA